MVTTEKILSLLTTQHILQILEDNNIAYKDENNPKTIKCKAVCHGDNRYKLYYIKAEKYFYCFSNCGGMNIFNLLMNLNGWTFGQTIKYLCKTLNISYNYKKPKGFGLHINKQINDWNFINIYNKINNKDKIKYNLPSYDKNILTKFDKIYPTSWIKEYIALEAMKKFHILFHVSEFATIIPHYGLNGDLIGIRSRHHLQDKIDNGCKYMPTILENKMYNHPLQFNLYGAYQNQSIIKKYKKVLLVESEKSVLQCQSYYPNNNFSVAICGSNLSNAQRDILLYDLNVEEVIIGLDKQYETLDSEEHEQYVKKVCKIANKLVNYVNVYIIYCTDDRLDYKDSPTDKGQQILESLMKEKIRYYRTDYNLER